MKAVSKKEFIFILSLLFIIGLGPPKYSILKNPTSYTVLAKTNNGFDERQKKTSNTEKKSSKKKKVHWTTAILWLLFIAGFIEVVFLPKNSNIAGKMQNKFNRNGGDSSNGEV